MFHSFGFCFNFYIKEQEIQALFSRITIKSGLFLGKIIIRGLRFPDSYILEMLASGMKKIKSRNNITFLKKIIFPAPSFMQY